MLPESLRVWQEGTIERGRVTLVCLLVSLLAVGGPFDVCVVPGIGARAHLCLGSPKGQPLPGSAFVGLFGWDFVFLSWDCT